MRRYLKSKSRGLVVTGSLGLLVLISAAQTTTQERKPVSITRLYTGPDGQTHAEEVKINLGPGNVFQLMGVSGAELHRLAPGGHSEWHHANRRQYVITLSGRGEIEVAGGKKIAIEPGDIELAEDLTGKGHISRAVGPEDRVMVALPLIDQSPK